MFEKMNCYSGKYIWLLFLVCTCLHFSEASYELSVEVVSYASSSHARDDGLCCDNSQCVDDCNNSFNFCLLRPGADLNSTSDVDPCLNSSEQYVTGVVGGDMREFVIGENLDDGVPNPLLFTGERWPGSVDLYVRVNDGSPDDQDALVVELTVPISLNPASDNSQPVTIYQNPSGQGQFLRLAFQLTCAENFYGEDCSRFCLGRDDEGGHYSCDETGAIICLEGFEGDNCMQCILAPECSPVSAYCNSTHRCVCRDEYTGPFCAFYKNFCATFSPCQNGASCMNIEFEDGSTDYMCECTESYKGINCSKLKDCLSEPCQNGGTCTEAAPEEGGYKCQCPSGFQGTNCELESTEAVVLFMGPFIGAAVVIGVLLLIIVILVAILIYTFWQIKCKRPHNKHSGSPEVTTMATTHSQTEDTDCATACPNTYELDYEEEEERKATEAALIASVELEEGTNDLRKNSETFDNPIYDQPTPPSSRKKITSTSSERKLSSFSSSRSLSVSSTQDFPPHSRPMAIEGGAMLHKYEDVVMGGSEECLNASFRCASSPRSSTQQVTRGSETETVDKLTVINETYDPLPCHSLTSSGYRSFQGSGATNFTVVEPRRFPYKSINTGIVSSTEVLGKEPVPNGAAGRGGDAHKYPADSASEAGFHGNSLRLEIESCEQ